MVSCATERCALAAEADAFAVFACLLRRLLGRYGCPLLFAVLVHDKSCATTRQTDERLSDESHFLFPLPYVIR